MEINSLVDFPVLIVQQKNTLHYLMALIVCFVDKSLLQDFHAPTVQVRNINLILNQNEYEKLLVL